MRDVVRLENLISSLFCFGGFAVFLSYFLLRSPLIFLLSIFYAPIMSVIYKRKVGKMRFDKRSKAIVRLEHYMDIIVMSWFFLMIGLFLGKILP